MKTAVFGANSSFPPLLARRGDLVRSADEKASLFSAHFDAKQCGGNFQLPHSCDPVLCSVAFRFCFIRRLLSDLNSYGGIDPNDMDPLFCKQVAWKLAPKWAVVFNHLVKGSSFPAC